MKRKVIEAIIETLAALAPYLVIYFALNYIG